MLQSLDDDGIESSETNAADGLRDPSGNLNDSSRKDDDDVLSNSGPKTISEMPPNINVNRPPSMESIPPVLETRQEHRSEPVDTRPAVASSTDRQPSLALHKVDGGTSSSPPKDTEPQVSKMGKVIRNWALYYRACLIHGD